MRGHACSCARRAFSLIEVLVCVGVVATLIGVLLPALGGARGAARGAACLSNQRQLVTAWTLYAGDFAERAMPLAYWQPRDIGSGPQVFWWGTHGSATEPPDHARGFVAPYLDSTLRERSVYECPEQRWGTYRPQGPSRSITSTYGYNGYYLSPEKTPGWGAGIGHRPWRRLHEIQRPTHLLVFADTLLPGNPAGNTALLDPPMLWSAGSGWRVNRSPTTAFRHGFSHGGGAGSSAAGARADGSAAMHASRPEWLTHAALRVGSVGTEPGPWYVPDWEAW